MDPRLDRPYRNTQNFSGVVMLHAFDVDQQQRPSDLFGQLLHRIDDLLVGKSLQKFLRVCPVFEFRLGRCWIDRRSLEADGVGLGAMR